MKNENNNKKIMAEIEIRVGLKVYKVEINGQFRWLWVLGIILIKFIYNLYESYG